ncbi:3019_t:CDS:2 [Funneliformis geosporum]|uniref:3019_t:CDS:1 n=1 Tax=Funneliformis geosporum TaxID=1117311 RepID=A0A9W4SVN1_9GLOM|nr:3019_t:CDS:2 [Funneliformis geosporum]
MPGWEDSSWGYHGHDGLMVFNSEGKPFGPKFMTSDTIDTIGCCLNFRNNTVFYTRNGVNLGVAFRDLKKALYPYVGMMSTGGSVGANFGYRKFKYTVERSIATLSGKLTGITLLIDHFGTHLDLQEKVINL